jgi:hypothetical protein
MKAAYGWPGRTSHGQLNVPPSDLLFQLNDECIEAGWIAKIARRSPQRAVPWT